MHYQRDRTEDYHMIEDNQMGQRITVYLLRGTNHTFLIQQIFAFFLVKHVRMSQPLFL